MAVTVREGEGGRQGVQVQIERERGRERVGLVGGDVCAWLSYIYFVNVVNCHQENNACSEKARLEIISKFMVKLL